MRSKNIWTIVTLLVLLGLVTACAAPAKPTEAPQPTAAAPAAVATEAAPAYTTEGKVIYNVGFLKGHPVIRLMTLGFILGAKDLGYDYKLVLSDGSDYGKMSQDLEQANAEGATAVVGFVADPAVGPAVAMLGKSGIPFCSAHFPQPEGKFPGMTAWASTETEPYAKAVAQAMGDELRKRGVKSGKIAITQGNFNTVENTVAKVFAETIKAGYPEFTPLDAQEEGFDPPPAIAKAAAIIQANPDIVGALSTTGAGPTTWARAAEENGLPDGKIVIISMDYTRPNLDLVKQGKVFGLVGQPLVEEFRACVHIVDKVLRGEKYDYANPLPAPIITLKDIDTYYAYNDMVEKELGAGANAPATPAPEPTKEAAAPTAPQKTAAEMGCKYGKDGKCRVVLVNSFLGNDYRIQMQRSAEAASKYEPYASVVDFSILNTENTPEAQRAGLENLLAEGVDAILLNAVDNTSVNDLVEKACSKDVKVVTFDITAKPGACEKAIDFGFCNWAYDAGQWEALAAGADKHPINVIMDKGLQGVDIADDIYRCGLEGMYKVAPKENIKIVGEYYGEFAEGVQEPLISAILAANPDKKIDLVHTQGYCTTVKSAFENAGLDYLPIMYCQGYNANAVLCTQKGVNCVVQLDTFAGSIGALDTAYRWMAGEEVPAQIPWPTDFGVTIPGIDITVRTPSAKVSMLETGVNAFPDLPPGFGPLYNWPGAYVQITVEEAAGLKK